VAVKEYDVFGHEVSGGAAWARSVGFPCGSVRIARKDNWEATSRMMAADLDELRCG
jgi:hypothetical protein